MVGDPGIGPRCVIDLNAAGDALGAERVSQARGENGEIGIGFLRAADNPPAGPSKTQRRYPGAMV